MPEATEDKLIELANQALLDEFIRLAQNLEAKDRENRINQKLEAIKSAGIINTPIKTINKVKDANGKTTELTLQEQHENTLLHEAVKLDNPQIIKLLISNGADINAQNNEGNTPLHEAANLGNKEVIDLLLYAVADYKITNKEGKTPQQTIKNLDNKKSFNEAIYEFEETLLKEGIRSIPGDAARALNNAANNAKYKVKKTLETGERLLQNAKTTGSRLNKAVQNIAKQDGPSI